MAKPAAVGQARRLIKDGLIGGFVGCGAKTVTAPLARLTVVMQTSSLLQSSELTADVKHHLKLIGEGGILNGLTQMRQKEGLRSFFKGHLCTCIHRFPSSSLNFGAMKFRPSGSSLLTDAGVSVGAGLISVTLCYPLEVVRTHQMQPHLALKVDTQGFLKCFWYLRCTQGLYRGLGVSLLATVPTVATTFFAYPHLKNVVQESGDHVGVWATPIAGGCSGMLGSAMWYPLDTVRRRVQVMAMDQSIPSRSWWKEARDLWSSEGRQGLYRGFTPEIAKVVPTAVVAFCLYERLHNFFD